MKQSFLPPLRSVILGTITASALLVIIGWVVNIPILTTLFLGSVSMKLTTAIGFVLISIMLWSMHVYIKKQSPVAEILLPWSSLAILLLMSTLLIAKLLGISTGIEELLLPVSSDGLHFYEVGKPSVATKIGFLTTALSGLLTLLPGVSRKIVFNVCISLLLILSLLALLGHLFGMPAFYFEFEEISTPMALSTAILFLLTAAYFSLSKPSTRSNQQ